MNKKLVMTLVACIIMGTLSGCVIKNDAPMFERGTEIVEENISPAVETHTEEVAEEETQE